MPTVCPRLRRRGIGLPSPECGLRRSPVCARLRCVDNLTEWRAARLIEGVVSVPRCCAIGAPCRSTNVGGVIARRTCGDNLPSTPAASRWCSFYQSAEGVAYVRFGRRRHARSPTGCVQCGKAQRRRSRPGHLRAKDLAAKGAATANTTSIAANAAATAPSEPSPHRPPRSIGALRSPCAPIHRVASMPIPAKDASTRRSKAARSAHGLRSERRARSPTTDSLLEHRLA